MNSLKEELFDVISEFTIEYKPYQPRSGYRDFIDILSKLVVFKGTRIRFVITKQSTMGQFLTARSHIASKLNQFLDLRNGGGKYCFTCKKSLWYVRDTSLRCLCSKNIEYYPPFWSQNE